MTHSWGSKFMTIVLSFIIHTENYHFLSTGHEIRGLDLHENHENWYPSKFKSSTVHGFYNKVIVHRNLKDKKEEI